MQNFESFDGYTIFLDEYNSLIEYLICCPLLNKNRRAIYSFLQKILRQSDRILCTDADVNEISLRYMELMDIEFDYIVNEYKHNDGIQAQEIFSFNKFMKAVNNEPKKLICCDSKTQSEVISHVNCDEYVLITSDGWYDSRTKETTKGKIPDLDCCDCVIYSPAIMYGLDSLMERPVFCYFKEHTISPVGMVQQLCRCRNITFLRYLFTDKKWKPYKYHSFIHTQQEIVDRELYGCKILSKVDEETGERYEESEDAGYNELLSKYLYRDDCYNTNKFAHFINIIKARGFKIDMKFSQTSIKGLKCVMEDMNNLKIETFLEYCNNYNKHIEPLLEEYQKEYDGLQPLIKEYCLSDTQYEKKCEYRECYYKDKYNLIVAKDYGLYNDKIVEINEMLQIPYNDLEKYSELFLNQFELSRHFTITKFFNNTQLKIKTHLDNKDDFNPNKPYTQESRFLTLLKFRSNCGLKNDTIDDLKIIKVEQPLNEKCIKPFVKEYKIVFNRCQVKELPDFKEQKHAQEYLFKMYKNMFGKDIISKRKTTKKGKSLTIYDFNHDCLDGHQKLYNYRHKAISKPDNDFGFLSDSDDE